MSATSPDHRPENAPKRSFHYRDLVETGARFRPLNDSMVVADYGGAGETETAATLGIADLSVLPRTGFKGPRMAEWLAAQGIVIGEASNRAYPARDMLAARLAPGEVLILGALDGQPGPIAALGNACSYDCAGVWPVPRQDASFWFMVTGSQSPTMFAKICGVDLRPKSFADHAIAQTSVARSNAIVIRADLGGVPAFHLLGDSAFASFFWASVIDAMAEFAGRPVGLDALLELAGG